jgi:serine/threonine protein kinase
VRELGRTTSGSTWLARDTGTGALVAARLLSLGLVSDWKTIELFEREAAVLKSLRHPRIPAYVDSFHSDLPGDPRFVLVREYIEGSDLQLLVEGGWRGTEEQIRSIGLQLVEVVSYIHSLRPPVIHRDITPRNVVARQDGEIFLLDFGGAQDAIRLPGSAEATVVGTPGYAPMEQFMGRATVRSDLYGLAATLVFLLTRRSPADLPTKALKLDFASVVDIDSAGLARVLSNWLEPDEAARTLTLTSAAALLSQGPGETAGSGEIQRPGARRTPPSGSRIAFTESGDGATYVLPMSGSVVARRTGSFGLIWLVLVGFWIYAAARMRAPAGFLLVAILFLAVGVGLTWRAMASAFGRFHLRIARDGVSYASRFLFPWRRGSMPLAEAGECRAEGDALLLDVGARTLRMGDRLSRREREWLRDSVNGLLEKLRGGPPP